MYWNKELFKIGLSEEEFQAKLQKLIVIEEKNTILNHLFESNKGSVETVRGQSSKDRFTIWRTNRNWNGVFYPIFIGNYCQINKTNVLELRTRFNPFAEIIVLILAIGIAYGILIGIIIQANNEFKFLFRRSLIGILLFLLFQSVPLISYYNLKNQTIKGLKEYFQLSKVKLKKRKQR